MSRLITQSLNPNLAVALFLEAARVTDFQQRWMTADTWAELIIHRFNIDLSLSFNGSYLVKALGNKQHKHTWNLMECDRRNIPRDHIGIFRDKYCPRGSSPVHCFYATLPGHSPTQTNKNEKWFDSINDALDLLSKRTTRSQVEQTRTTTEAIITTATLDDCPSP